MEEGCYSISELMLLMTERIGETARSLDLGDAGRFIDMIIGAERIYVAGAGRSGLVGRAFAMRLRHLGLEAFVVGETITPAMRPGDTLVAFSGSGETNSIVDICESVRDLGGRICLITATPESRIGGIANCIVNLGEYAPRIHGIPGRYEVRQLTGQYRSVSTSLAPFGALFEITALIFSDAVLSALMELRHCSLEEIKGRLPNIQ
ncbi:6-phospho-3-hexuloisomerase [Methanofollis fontis]|uniref:6-phospho-3-hexuloisomerase n=2 Tax=Methanofollis fontis TaxID=2052832 RepID=A0A483CKN8_9EURY|nr:6-phospho-3-hexuloisomerase [Methanofollis fontis]